MSASAAAKTAADTKQVGAAPQAAVDINSIQEAMTRISPYIHRTPLLRKSNMEQISGFKKLLFKAESFQRTSSFKYRGALSAVLLLAEQQQGSLQLVTHSSGNFGEAVSRAVADTRKILATGDGSAANSITAHIALPTTEANRKKEASIRRYGAIVHACTPQTREATAQRLLTALGPSASFIDQYQSPLVVNGYATIGLELLDQLSSINKVMPDVIIVPMGGAALLAGVSAAIKQGLPKGAKKVPLIIGAEPASHSIAAACFAAKSLSAAAGAVPDRAISAALTDGLLTHLNPTVWALIRDHTDGIVSVSDEQIRAATLLCLERLKIVVEPSAAIAAAVALFHRGTLQSRFPSRQFDTAVVVLSEGNLHVEAFISSRL